MTPSPATSIATPTRSRLKAQAPTTGFVDGAWWPASRDLAAELPELLAALADRPGRIERVTYNLTEWEAAGSRLKIDGQVVRLEGFRSQHPDTVTVTGQGWQRLTLFVVPPETGPAAANDAMTTASQRGNGDTVEELVALSRAR
ncbi:DUF5994 family protein [Amycolatopsis sp.]|uniref:DUF5994 family protein n=1 Tax=Amycolatopsis sp. TaxID=37632 RepID=UPI002CDCCAAA|nr:DUF5994 family protein [Amycolatopsis sp.]HVV08578.1 DUF5994 family protein [Amycolatopsis sp.]